MRPETPKTPSVPLLNLTRLLKGRRPFFFFLPPGFPPEEANEVFLTGLPDSGPKRPLPMTQRTGPLPPILRGVSLCRAVF